ncbi:MAG: hypothetical protein LH472_00245 [Pyrinomonadaceae bacterium]|nr:hypothetical protein [Pyrinomonadaceae bacterium]
MTAALQKNDLVDKLPVLTRIALADKAAAQECIDVYGAMIWTLAKQFTDSTEAAERAVQEIFIDIWKNAAFCDLTVSDEEIWIALIARRRLTEYSTETAFHTPTSSAARIIPNQNSGIVA